MLWLVQAIRGYYDLNWKVDLNSCSSKLSSTKCRYVPDFQWCHGLTQHSVAAVCIILWLFYLMPLRFLCAAIIACSHEWWSVSGNFSCCRDSIQDPTGTFMSALCNGPTRHLSHLPETLSCFSVQMLFDCALSRNFFILSIFWAPTGLLFLIFFFK